MPFLKRFIKRAFDIVCASLGLLVLWPVIWVCIVIAKRDTGLSGLFSQRRVGRYGKLIDVRKIRTMRKVEGVDTTITVANDLRITAVGRKLRRWKLDELPQLWNVLTGEMSLVGPRPDVPGYADGLVGEQRDILQLRPGITGPATIKYTDEEILLNRVRDAKTYNDSVLYPDKVRLNLRYLHHWTLLGDVRYILITLRLIAKPVELEMLMPTNADRA